MTKTSCSLCGQNNSQLFHQDKKRIYRRCSTCDLVFVPERHHVSKETEKSKYDYHENDPSHKGYAEFLNKLVSPLIKYLKPGMQGLDFGSGPGPTLHLLMENKGYPMQVYDPFYDNDKERLSQQYDFVTSSEVVEHFSNPKNSWNLLLNLVKFGGILGIMTLRHDEVDFPKWWYKNDVTHVAFYSLKTFQWIAENFHLKIKYYNERVIIFSK